MQNGPENQLDLFRHSPVSNGGTNGGNLPPFFSEPLRETRIAESPAILRHGRRMNGGGLLPHSVSPQGVPSAEKVRKLRISLTELTEIKMQIMPDVDSYRAMRQDAISRIQNLTPRIDQKGCIAPLKGQPNNTEIITQHDRILEAATRWGKSINQYRLVQAAINATEKEIETLEAKRTQS